QLVHEDLLHDDRAAGDGRHDVLVLDLARLDQVRHRFVDHLTVHDLPVDDGLAQRLRNPVIDQAIPTAVLHDLGDLDGARTDVEADRALLLAKHVALRFVVGYGHPRTRLRGPAAARSSKFHATAPNAHKVSLFQLTLYGFPSRATRPARHPGPRHAFRTRWPSLNRQTRTVGRSPSVVPGRVDRRFGRLLRC